MPIAARMPQPETDKQLSMDVAVHTNLATEAHGSDADLTQAPEDVSGTTDGSDVEQSQSPPPEIIWNSDIDCEDWDYMIDEDNKGERTFSSTAWIETRLLLHTSRMETSLQREKSVESKARCCKKELKL